MQVLGRLKAPARTGLRRRSRWDWWTGLDIFKGLLMVTAAWGGRTPIEMGESRKDLRACV